MDSQPDRLLTWPQVAEIIPYTRQHAARLAKVGKFPQPVQLGANRVAWWQGEILAWAKAQPRGPLAPRAHASADAAA